MIAKLRKYVMAFVLIILIPQVVNVMSCSMFSGHQLRELPTAVYMGDNTSFTRMMVKSFDDNETFDIKYYVENPEDIKELIREGKVVFGLVIPRDFTKDMKNLKSPSLLTVIDGSMLSAASYTKIASNEILLTLKSGALINVMKGQFNFSTEQAENAIRAMNIQNRLIGNPTRNYLNFLMPGFMTALVQVGLAMAAATSIKREKRRSLATYTFSKILAYTALGLASMMMIIFVQVHFFQVPFRSGVGEIFLLSAAFAFCVSAVGVMISTIVWNKVLATQVAAIFFLPSTILSGYTWPISSMPELYKYLAQILPFTHYGDILRDLMLKGYSSAYGSSIRYLLIYGLVAWILGMVGETIRETILHRLKKRRCANETH